jgi:hypothetical protein
MKFLHEMMSNFHAEFSEFPASISAILASKTKPELSLAYLKRHTRENICTEVAAVMFALLVPKMLRNLLLSCYRPADQYIYISTS